MIIPFRTKRELSEKSNNQSALMKKTVVIYKEGYPKVKEKIKRLGRLMKLFHLISIPNKFCDLFE